MLQKGEQLKLAEVRSQPGRAGTLDQRLLHGAYVRLSQHQARPPLVVLPVAADQRWIKAPLDAGLASPCADSSPGELGKRDQQLRQVRRRETGAVHLVTDRRDLFQLLTEPALGRGRLLADSSRRGVLVRVHQVTLALAASPEQSTQKRDASAITASDVSTKTALMTEPVRHVARCPFRAEVAKST